MILRWETLIRRVVVCNLSKYGGSQDKLGKDQPRKKPRGGCLAVGIYLQRGSAPPPLSLPTLQALRVWQGRRLAQFADHTLTLASTARRVSRGYVRCPGSPTFPLYRDSI